MRLDKPKTTIIIVTVLTVLCAERNIFTLALPAAALCDKQNCTVFGVKPSPLIGKVMFCTAAESVNTDHKPLRLFTGKVLRCMSSEKRN